MEPAPDADSATSQAAQGEPAPLPPARKSWLRTLWPWVSLAVGIASAVTMDRGPKRALGVAIAALLVWLLLLIQQWLVRLDPQSVGGKRARLLHLGRRSSLAATQSALQMMLAFSLPFYVQAADLHDPGHLGFLSLLVMLSAASLWDPLSEYLLSRPHLGPLLPAMGSFVALCAVLPGLGLSTQHSAWIAAGVAGLGAAAMLIVTRARGTRGRALPFALLIALSLPLSLYAGAGRVVPAAPLRLVAIELGSGFDNHWISQPFQDGDPAPPRLLCATAIWSPIGVRDRLFHVWRRDGALRVKVELEIRGGRGLGFRTYSRITPGHNAAGLYRCSVETGNGQVLGSKSVHVR